jgi:hypothetical protein
VSGAGRLSARPDAWAISGSRHTSASIVDLEQEPESVEIIGTTPRLLRYFNKGF